MKLPVQTSVAGAWEAITRLVVEFWRVVYTHNI